MSDTFVTHGWTIQVFAYGDSWKWDACMGYVEFDSFVLAGMEGHPSQLYPSSDAARVAAIQWAAENER